MSHTTVVIRRSKKYEKLLTERLGASGNGLSELMRSVREKLSHQLATDLAALASTRNQFAHDINVEHLKDVVLFVATINRIEEALSHVLSDYKMEPVCEDELRTSPPKEKIVYVPSPSAAKIVTVHGVSSMIVIGAVLIALSVLLALINGGFTEATTYTVQEPVHRWWWFDGTRDVVMAETQWRFPMFLLLGGSITCAVGAALQLVKSKD